MDYSQIKTPNDLKRLNISELDGLCEFIREKIIGVVENNGGHLSSNLGAVELIVALHYVFDCPNDKLVFDVGHQAYAHKIITGRGDAFSGLRKNGGISGFPRPDESEYDTVVAGHASTSLSIAAGLAESVRQKKENKRVIAVIGDGALTGGLAYEALNAIGSDQLPVIIVLNDNEMSISKNVGAISKHLTRLRVSKRYTRIKGEVKRAVSAIPLLGDGVIHLLEKGKHFLKRMVLSNKIFEAMGISYYGPFDGHDIRELVEVFSQVKNNSGRPILVHAITDKGRGLKSAAVDPAHSHGITSVGAKSGKQFSDVLGEFLTTAAKTDSRIMAVTAAMSIGTGLEGISKAYPERFKDVGIAEEHAATYCAALAAGGMKPYFAVYSTFLQRAYDEVMHDACIGKYPVTFCIDRAGAVGADGVTHQGVFDLSYLLPMPNMTVMCPTDGAELKSMLEFSLTFDAPLAIRYPKSYVTEREHAPIVYGKWESVKKSDPRVFALCVGGRTLDIATEAAQKTAFNIINCRFAKPLDVELLREINKAGNLIITLEDNVASGGFGSAVLCALNAQGLKAKCVSLAHGDEFIDDREVNSTLAASGLSVENLLDIIKRLKAQSI